MESLKRCAHPLSGIVRRGRHRSKKAGKRRPCIAQKQTSAPSAGRARERLNLVRWDDLHLRPRLVAGEKLIEILVRHEVQIFAIGEAGASQGSSTAHNSR
jgi:hypothetical protein